jgi:hypothetical protein
VLAVAVVHVAGSTDAGGGDRIVAERQLHVALPDRRLREEPQRGGQLVGPCRRARLEHVRYAADGHPHDDEARATTTITDQRERWLFSLSHKRCPEKQSRVHRLFHICTRVCGVR